MQEKFYVDATGNFIGTFIGHEVTQEDGTIVIIEPDIPEGAVEVASAPSDARKVWDGSAWLDVNEVVYYADLRSISYPSIGDQLDAIFKGGTSFDDMQTQIQSVKTRYPKV